MENRIPKVGDRVLVNVSSSGYEYREGVITKLAEDRRGDVTRVLVKYETWLGIEAEKWESAFLDFVDQQKF